MFGIEVKLVLCRIQKSSQIKDQSHYDVGRFGKRHDSERNSIPIDSKAKKILNAVAGNF